MIPLARIVLEGCNGRGLKRQLPRLVELGLPDPNQPSFEVEVGTVQVNRFT
jgi:hypothetical protein